MSHELLFFSFLLLFCVSTADYVVIMKEGRIERQGTYKDLVAGGLDLHALIGNEEPVDDGDDLNDISGDDDDDERANVGSDIYGAPKEGRRPSCTEVRSGAGTSS